VHGHRAAPGRLGESGERLTALERSSRRSAVTTCLPMRRGSCKTHLDARHRLRQMTCPVGNSGAETRAARAVAMHAARACCGAVAVHEQVGACRLPQPRMESLANEHGEPSGRQAIGEVGDRDLTDSHAATLNATIDTIADGVCDRARALPTARNIPSG
jgi:hypothetical protein